MEKIFHYPLARIGIIGGGQLGKMMAQKAQKMGFHVTILTPDPDCPAAPVSDMVITGGFHDEEKISELVQQSDVTTIEIEHINTAILKDMASAGHRIYPSPDLLEMIKDKYQQKEMLKRHGIPTPAYHFVDSPGSLKKLGFPVVQKACRGGYDGKGVMVLRDERDIEKAIQAESFIEEYIPFEMELAVMVARSIQGDIRCYPVVAMEFDDRANICDLVTAPSGLDPALEKQARDIAVNTVKALDGVGIFGVEMFLSNGKILVNEIAPRPHNSGHYTIEACVTCQFEQHIRAITGLPLGAAELLCPAAMINLLGEEGYAGRPVIEGLERALSIPGLSFHLYGKDQTRPYRKMGHITVIDRERSKAIEKALEVKQFLKIKGEKQV